MNFTDIFHFLQTYQVPLGIISTGALIYCTIIKFLGKIPLVQVLTMFFTGIIVITCIFLPFNWSIQNSGTGREVSLFFFEINVEGNNFIAILKNLLSKNEYIPIIEWYFSRYNEGGASLPTDIITVFLAFLEEFSKLGLLILAIRKSLRLPIMIIYLFLVYGLIHKMGGIASLSSSTLGGLTVAGLTVGGILWYMLSAPLRTVSVADYIYSIALVAAGFAFAENIKYMIEIGAASHGDMQAIKENAILRSVFGYLSHIFFSMVCVSLYARGRFAFLRYIDQSGNLSFAQKALGWKGFTQLKTIQGFWFGVICASLIHGVYNIMIGTGNIMIPSVILIIGFLFLELFVLHDLRNNTKYGNLEIYMK